MSSAANCVSAQCASQSVGPSNQLFMALIQTFLTAQCNIANPKIPDYGEEAMKNGLILK